MLHFGPNALPCNGGTAQITKPKPAPRPNWVTPANELTTFVERNLSIGEIVSLGRRIAKHHGIYTHGPLHRSNTVAWFDISVARCLSGDDARRYLAELRRRQRVGEPFVRSDS